MNKSELVAALAEKADVTKRMRRKYWPLLLTLLETL